MDILGVIILGCTTACGGGVLRDVFAQETPFIFRKHFYACASLIGAILCAAAWKPFGPTISMLAGTITIICLRLLASHYRWKLPRA